MEENSSASLIEWMWHILTLIYFLHKSLELLAKMEIIQYVSHITKTGIHCNSCIVLEITKLYANVTKWYSYLRNVNTVR